MNEGLTDLWNELRDDRSRGSTELARYALDQLQSFANGVSSLDRSTSRRIARSLKTVRPEMHLLVNTGRLIEEILESGSERDPGQRKATFKSLIENLNHRLESAFDKILESFRSLNRTAKRIVVFSRSGTLLAMVSEIRNLQQVTVLESHPGNEGVSFANDLRKHQPVTFVYDLEAASHLPEADLLLLGADSYDEEGAIRNKTGSRLLAKASASTPVAACFQTLKFQSNDNREDIPTVTSPESLDEPLRREHPLFERVEPDLIDVYVTDNGLVRCPANLETLRRESIRDLKNDL